MLFGDFLQSLFVNSGGFKNVINLSFIMGIALMVAGLYRFKGEINVCFFDSVAAIFQTVVNFYVGLVEMIMNLFSIIFKGTVFLFFWFRTYLHFVCHLLL